MEDATAWALAQKKPQRAVEILEQGRGVLFTELGRYRTPLDELPNRELAAKFAELSSQLENTLVSGSKVGVMAGDGGRKSSVDEVGM